MSLLSKGQRQQQSIPTIDQYLLLSPSFIQDATMSIESADFDPEDLDFLLRPARL
jgi:hypothetical protein